MVFPRNSDRIADFHVLMGIAKEIPNHAHVPGIGKFHKDDYVRPAFFQRPVDRMPHAFECIDLAVSSALMPAEVSRATTVTNPFRTELKGATGITPLDQQFVLFRAFPKRRIEAVRHGRG
jgi:hypothetical protein